MSRDMVGILLLSIIAIAAFNVVSSLVLVVLDKRSDIRFLNTDVYPIGYLPSDLRAGDVVLINGVAVLLCFLASLYPARRAAQLPPAEALRHD